MWVRLGHFLRAWTKFLSRKQTDNWAAQAKAERGSGNGYLVPVLVVLLVLVAAVFTWFQLPPVAKSTVLAVGWPILGVITGVQTLTMLGKLFQRHRGYRV
jgi:biofilm PGA synthesis N-glycosyltransferase PgaC